MLARGGLPGDASNAIEAKQAEFRAQPEITVGRLRDRLDGAVGKAFADLPRRVRVLIDVERRVQSESTAATRQEKAQRDNGSSMLARAFHGASFYIRKRFEAGRRKDSTGY